MAQRTASAFKTTKNSRYADNTSGSVTAANSRDMFEDTADSFLNISDHLIDEDDMASDSATKVPSQQSVKAYVDGKISVSGWQSVTVAVSSADILSLFTTPKEIIPAPGAGKYIQVLAGYVLLDVGTAYSDTTTQLVYGTGQVVAGTITSFLTR